MKNETCCPRMLLSKPHTWPSKDKVRILQTSFVSKQKQAKSQPLRSRAFHSLGWFASSFVLKKQFGSLIKEITSKSNYQALQMLSMPRHATTLAPILPGISPCVKTSVAPPIMDTGSAHHGHGILKQSVRHSSASHQARNRGIMWISV